MALVNGQLRVISMVPSWTETLAEAGVNVVGRTRFCIHPEEIKKVPAIGGTKDIQWKKVTELKPDLILFDAEENPQDMAKACPYPWISSHVKSVEDVAHDLAEISKKLENSELLHFSKRWERIQKLEIRKRSLKDIPGILEFVNPITSQIKNVIYLIWQKPWMSVSKKTFIGSVFEKLGLSWALLDFDSLYPEIDLAQFDPDETLLLFSTEPFPFHKRKEMIKTLPFPSAIIDGEAYSWFGLRTLKFLEDNLVPG